MSIRALLFPPAARPGSPVWQPRSRAGQAATCVSFPVPLPRCWCKAGEETTLSFCALWLSAVPAACQGRCPPPGNCCHTFVPHFPGSGFGLGMAWPVGLDHECGEGLWEQDWHPVLSPNASLLFLSVAGFLYSFEMKKVHFKPTVSSSIAPNCRSISD